MVYCRTRGILHEGISWIYCRNREIILHEEISRIYCSNRERFCMKNDRRIIIIFITLEAEIAVP
jgi:hypothetical protein